MDITGVKVYYKATESTEATTTEDTTTATDTTIDGTVLEINAEENTAKIELSDGSEVVVPLDLLDDTIKEDSAVNVKFENGQPVSVTKLGAVTNAPSDTTVDTSVDTSVDNDSNGEEDSTQAPEVTTTDGDTNVDSSSLVGDVNGDGNVLADDLLLMKKYVLGIVDKEDINFANADVTGDGEVLAIDLAYLKKCVLGIISEDELANVKNA
jgi:hypothetical protein